MTALAAMLTYSLGPRRVPRAPVFALALVCSCCAARWRRRLLTWPAIAVAVLVLACADRAPPAGRPDRLLHGQGARDAIRDPNPAHLPGPADRRLVWGSWVGTDFRYPYERWRVTETGIQIAVLLACLGVVWCPAAPAAGAARPARRGDRRLPRDPRRGGHLLDRQELPGRRLPARPGHRGRRGGAGGAAAPADGRCSGASRGRRRAARRLRLRGVALARLRAGRHGVLEPRDHAARGRSATPARGGSASGWSSTTSPRPSCVTLHNVFELTYLPLDRGYAVGRTPPTRVAGRRQLPAGFLDPYEYIIERRVGGLSLPPPPFALAAADRRLPALATPGRRPAAGAAAGRAAGPARAGSSSPRARASASPTRRWQRVRVGVRPLDGWYLPLCGLRDRRERVGALGRLGRHPLGQHRRRRGARHVRPGRPHRRALPRQRHRLDGADSFRLVIDGQELRPPVATALESRDGGQYLGTLELAPGRHRIELWSPERLDAAAQHLLRAGRVAGARGRRRPERRLRERRAATRPPGIARWRPTPTPARSRSRTAATCRCSSTGWSRCRRSYRSRAGGRPAGGSSQRSRMPSWKRRKAGRPVSGFAPSARVDDGLVDERDAVLQDVGAVAQAGRPQAGELLVDGADERLVLGGAVGRDAVADERVGGRHASLDGRTACRGHR